MTRIRRHPYHWHASLLCFAFALLLVNPRAPVAQDKNAPQNSNSSNAAPSSAPPQNQNDSSELLLTTDLVTMTVTVTDFYDRYVTGLDKSHFTVLDNKVPQEITFFTDEDAPASVGVIFDVSGSMKGDKVMRAREALSKFVETSHDKDEYFLVGFNTRAHLLLDRTRDADAVLNKLTYIETKGNTALYDAAYLGVEKVTRGAHTKKAILLISDGQDNSSRYTFRELQRLLKESGVLIYSVGITGGGNDSYGAQGQAILEELSGVSGGKAFFPASGAEMNEIFERIAIELRHQYSIGYRPTNFTPDGKWHNVKIKVQPPRGMPKLSVRAKDGYYAVPGTR
ncbi:MAG: VWA domain-containing protein [Pyrinomonadaceae bacterium MAG19_C2-C3]|nr:VWA domain-containing protein [Pyrinomonadaceae bacterium MAG19_C2-C3]